MSSKRNHHSKQFKLDAINYRNEHPNLTQTECAKNLGIGVSTLAKWESQFRNNNGNIPVRGSGNYGSDDTVGKYMREIGIKAQWIKPWTTTTRDSDFSTELQNILDEQFNPQRPNAVWCTDITYIWTQNGFVYLNCVMDLFARKIIAWTLSNTMEVSNVVATINKAKAYRNIESPLIIHSDRGSRYVSNAWREATKTMKRSYSRCAYPYDNACIESFHSLIKREWLNRFSIQNYSHAYRLVFDYIEAFYNTVRIHSHCDYMSPYEFEALYNKTNVLPAS